MNHHLINQIEKIKKTIPSHVRLIAVTKTVSVEVIKILYDRGLRDFAENKLQLALIKQSQLENLPDICWHFIGHLQTNKAKKAVESFPWIHSVDSLKIAQKLNLYAQQAYQENTIKNLPQVCLQVKLLPDDNKYGWSVENLWQDLTYLQQLNHLNIRGLMTILPLGLSSEEKLSTFQKLTTLADKIKEDNYFTPQFTELSMGMSEDYPLAISAGATMVRLGRILFEV